MEVKEFCDKMDFWAKLSIDQKGNLTPDFDKAWSTVRLAIRKSCLLDRMMYGDEQPSQTPCPVHKGKWSGCHWRWPGRVMVQLIDHGERKKGDAWLTPSEGLEKEWYDAGCRCAYHTCGCTTGWNPDEHCGCGGEEKQRKEILEKYNLTY